METGFAESCRESGRHSTWSDAVRHWPTAVVQLQSTVGERCTDSVCCLHVRFWCTPTCSCAALRSWVSRQVYWPVAEGKSEHFALCFILLLVSYSNCFVVCWEGWEFKLADLLEVYFVKSFRTLAVFGVSIFTCTRKHYYACRDLTYLTCCILYKSGKCSW